MNARKLRNAMTVQAPLPSKNQFGEPISSWAVEAEDVPCCVEQIEQLTREQWSGRDVLSLVTHKVTMRFYPGLTIYHRLLIKGVVFEISYIVDVGGAEVEHNAYCKELQ